MSQDTELLAEAEVAAFEAWARSQGFQPTDFERIENRPSDKYGHTWQYNGNYLQAAWAAWIERSLLTRTEAGAGVLGGCNG